ncbi:hypothetical protein C475_06050 [Halosimplex carlsbadense 2-9-1]|uniref:Uncharacterized protein n=1 Tax=Halosimplex carlsbadense 2-9-1 TaxID=797114 RepID=M0CXU9_9EURY|nr:hypothetical protein [Halosimplex carlsbadense]ELZ27458.1 hypothetical protein C475_06050 [Halosimplex carlsbadense 2-9-1]
MVSRPVSNERLVSVVGTVVALALLLVGGAVTAEVAFEIAIADGPVVGAPDVGIRRGAVGFVAFLGGCLVLRTVASRDASPPSEDEKQDSDTPNRLIGDW